MHHYQFNIGDYRKDTGHLSLLEHGIYRMLLDTYYLSDGVMEADDAKIMRTHCVRTADEQQAYKNVISDFFQLRDGHYFHTGCDKVLGRIYEKSDKARASAQARWDKKLNKNNNKEKQKTKSSEENANAMRTHGERNANGMLPITHNPLPNINNKYKDFDFSSWPSMPDPQVLSDWFAMRKRIKADVSQTVINNFGAELTRAKAGGYSVDYCLSEAITRNWRGLKTEWLRNADNKPAHGKRESKSERSDRAARDYLATLAEDDGGDLAWLEGGGTGSH